MGGRAAAHDADDDRFLAAVLEELVDGVRQGRGLPQSTEQLLVLGEALDARRFADRPFERTADEGGDGCGSALKRQVGGRSSPAGGSTPCRPCLRRAVTPIAVVVRPEDTGSA